MSVMGVRAMSVRAGDLEGHSSYDNRRGDPASTGGNVNGSDDGPTAPTNGLTKRTRHDSTYECSELEIQEIHSSYAL